MQMVLIHDPEVHSSPELQLDQELYPHPFLGLYTHIMCATEPRIKHIKYILPKFFNNYIYFGTELISLRLENSTNI